MPCNGVTVASAKVPLEEQKYIALAGQAIIDQVVKAYLGNLGYTVAGEDGYFTANSAQTGYFRFTVSNGYVSVSGGPSGLETQIKTLLSGLAGKMRQKVVMETMAKAGVKINGSQTAPNGAIVLELEI